ncbi:helix-turn-helix domain-containing protein [Janibacter limosus]|uniref:PucR family transcriptional regulator n=1 Tax=Janibacter limosus TaxID=53458 RepID=UPI00082DDA90|nr:helix-turn-helix domain-containing protein [Janibacter limosus]
MARHLLATNEPELAQLTPRLVAAVAKEIGVSPVPLDHKWPADIFEVVREFLACVAMNDLDRIGQPGSIFEQLGIESARGGVDVEQLATGIRVAVHRTQAQVHRAVLAGVNSEDPEAVLALLGRVVSAGEVVVAAARRGYAIAALVGDDEDDLLRRLANALIHGRRNAAELATAAWRGAESLACAIVISNDSAARIRRQSDRRVAYHPRERDVVLIHPIEAGRLATTLRPLLGDDTCAVGPAVPLTELPNSLDLAQRTLALAGPDRGPVFADDFLLELACSADGSVTQSLRRKHFADIDLLPDDQRSVLLSTLREWLLQWGHRPGIAETLGVHPQTVSGRINRLKDLLADDLEDPTVRAELLVLLTAEGAS